MDLDLKGKLIVVSGGASGIGGGIVKVLAAEGAIPVIIDCDDAGNNTAVKAVEAAGGKAFHVVAALSDPAACEAAIKSVMDLHDRIDGLVNCADLNDEPGTDQDNDDQFLTSLHKSLVHYYLLAHHALPALKISKGPIVNINFKSAVPGQSNASAYGGRNALTREWAVELLKYDIRVNAIIVEEWSAQASINTQTSLSIRATTAEEIANAVVFLLSSRSSHTTGQLIHVNAGFVNPDKASANM